MDYFQAAGIILTIWVVVRNIGNERECQLRMLDIRIHEDAAKATEIEQAATATTSPDNEPSGPARG